MSKQVKERPILFSGEMVRAILDGRKRQTRRMVKPQRDEYDNLGDGESLYDFQSEKAIPCPYGKPGDRLWVRETFSNHGGAGLVYRADSADGGPWTPSIFMPRKYCRILIEITDVRVERLNEISEEDAKTEGIVGVPFRPDDGWPICTGYMLGPDDGKTSLSNTAVRAFSKIWESINGKGSFDDRWVWVVEFKRLD